MDEQAGGALQGRSLEYHWAGDAWRARRTLEKAQGRWTQNGAAKGPGGQITEPGVRLNQRQARDCSR
ncbi:hypothetical protein PSEUDO9AG_50288 [Pseudomonas sp. 9Ag]|nr:hypothetical protein PSEUDO9AG_50288 [Pseudomonas sp. 9Ag]